MYKIFTFFFFFVCCCFTRGEIAAQPLADRLKNAYARFEGDPQLRYATHSLYVIDLSTGKAVFSRNARQGLAPASTQKVITAAAAFALLGADFRYTTHIGIFDNAGNDNGLAQLYICPSGDPSLGSHRYAFTRPEWLLQAIVDSLRGAGIRNVAEEVIIDRFGIDDRPLVPESWIVQDLGNYYGAGAGWLNWRENQYDLKLKSGPLRGKPVQIMNRSELPDEIDSIDNRLRSAAAGTGDNAWIYLPMDGVHHLIKGTIPANQSSFTISGAVVRGDRYFLQHLCQLLSREGVLADPGKQFRIAGSDAALSGQIVARFQSPALDSLSYWFLRKSVNLYGEAFLKRMGFEKGEGFSTDGGLAVLRRFWAGQGIDSNALRMKDGSGLSPENRVTAEALVQVMRYAKGQPWFPSYFEGFPLYNGMRMKSGTISGVKGFCGFQRSAKDGKEYVFAFLVNNYTGPSAGLVTKMYRVLNELK